MLYSLGQIEELLPRQDLVRFWIWDLGFKRHNYYYYTIDIDKSFFLGGDTRRAKRYT